MRDRAKNIHAQHCTLTHCKYGEDLPDDDGNIICDVVAGRVKQQFNSLDWIDPEDIRGEIFGWDEEIEGYPRGGFGN